MRFALTLSLVLAACRPAPPSTPADLEARLARIEQRLDHLSGVGDGGSDVPATADIRLLRVEQRVEKLVAFLRAAVPERLDESKVYAIPIDPRDPQLGPAGAAVTLVEAYEFLCPYCNVAEASLDQLRRRYPADLRVVSKYMVIHGEPAVPSGKAACAAQRQGKYAAFKDLMWKAIWPADGSMDREQAAEDAVARHARAAGLDMKRYAADVAGPCAEWLTETDRVLRQFGASGTPSFWINGRYVQGVSFDALGELIDAELARVKASGVAPATYYEQVVMGQGAREAVMTSPID